MKLTIVIERTANTTPERSWDYMAWFDGHEECGPRATGSTPLGALLGLFDGDCDEELEKLFPQPAEPTVAEGDGR
jgi:hypothetical protein